MEILLLKKTLLTLFILSNLNMFRHVYYFLQVINLSTEEETIKYKIKPTSLFLLGLSISYIISTLFTGINL
jgi:hypothetical protein